MLSIFLLIKPFCRNDTSPLSCLSGGILDKTGTIVFNIHDIMLSLIFWLEKLIKLL